MKPRGAALLPWLAERGMFAKVKLFLASVLPGILRPLHVLWNEVLGFLFLAFAVLLLRPLWRGYQEMEVDAAHFIKFLLSLFFFCVMLSFGIHAFWKARRISKS